ncbi:Nn.00g016490.m01.CDS01 [Neocucurbitaria sp. VM-36]
MASTVDQPPTAVQSSPQPAGSGSRPESSHEALSSSPVEMRTLQASAATSVPANPTAQPLDMPIPAHTNISTLPSTEVKPAESTQPAPSSSAKPATPANLNRSETEAIGPSTDTPAAAPDNSNGPVLVIMLLLTTGARHPYKIDERYLKKRNVAIEAMDPYNISVYTLKELIWRDWREDCRFQIDTPNVVHMTVKPQEVVDEEENAKTGKGVNRRDGEDEPTAGCRCVIL